MSRFTTITTAVAVAAVLVGLEVHVDAAEMKVRAECCPEGPIVTLGDLVDLHCDSTREAERLARITLFPTPAPGLRRFVSAREIKDMLLIRGIDLIDHQFHGARTVLVVGSEPKRATSNAVRLASASPRLAEKKLRETLSEWLNRAGVQPWQIAFVLDEDTARWISAAQSLNVQGDRVPSTGRQCFEITIQVGNETKTVDVIAEVSLPPLVVVPVRSIPRATRISRADLELRHVDSSVLTAGSVQHIEDIVAKEATRTLTAGKPIAQSHVCEPVLVRRGDVVTVIVRAAGIRVRTQARAQDDGAQGELVAVESLRDRRTYFAQVSGVREVEVLATTMSADDSNRTRSNQG
jgi:flagella basal body P-ring formation protein FlgA